MPKEYSNANFPTVPLCPPAQPIWPTCLNPFFLLSQFPSARVTYEEEAQSRFVWFGLMSIWRENRSSSRQQTISLAASFLRGFPVSADASFFCSHSISFFCSFRRHRPGNAQCHEHTIRGDRVGKVWGRIEYKSGKCRSQSLSSKMSLSLYVQYEVVLEGYLLHNQLLYAMII